MVQGVDAAGHGPNFYAADTGKIYAAQHACSIRHLF
jgi:hypothetical protein